MDKETLISGALLESAVAQKEAADKAIERLDKLSRSLEPTIRQAAGDAASEAVAQAARAEFERLRAETQRTAQALQGIRGGISWNLGILASAMAVLCTATAVGGMYLLGERTSPAAAPAAPPGLRGDPAVLAEFARRGLQVEVGLCGQARQPCVRVDPKSQAFGTGTGSRRETYLQLPAK